MMRDHIENALEQLDVLCRTLRRTRGVGDAFTQRDSDAALSRARRELEDALQLLPPRSTDGCTGIAASWCPIHGTCSCPRDASGEIKASESCTLHASSSQHGEQP